jgi:hypothetical protein
LAWEGRAAGAFEPRKARTVRSPPSSGGQTSSAGQTRQRQPINARPAHLFQLPLHGADVARLPLEAGKRGAVIGDGLGGRGGGGDGAATMGCLACWGGWRVHAWGAGED